MKRLLLVEWLVAEGVISYRSWTRNKHAPLPGELLGASGAFVLLALFAEISPDAAKLAATLGGGFVAASALNLFAKVATTAQKATSQPASAGTGVQVT